MAKTFYIPVSGESVKPKKWYVPVDGESAKVVKAYCSDDGYSKLFWSGSGLVIFEDGEFHNVPDGLNISSNVSGSTDSISALSSDYLTNKTLWVHDSSITSGWAVDSEDYINSGYRNLDNQVIKEELYIPVNKIIQASKLKITAKGNVGFASCYINNGTMTEGGAGSICNKNDTPAEINISSQVDYIKLSAPKSYYAEDETVQTVLPQPVPFTLNRIYTGNKGGQNYPGVEFVKATGGNVYFALMHETTYSSYYDVYMFSPSAFTVTYYEGRNASRVEYTLTGSLISSEGDDPIYAASQRLNMWDGYSFLNIISFNYSDSFAYYDPRALQMGQIVLYGNTNMIKYTLPDEVKQGMFHPDNYTLPAILSGNSAKAYAQGSSTLYTVYGEDNTSPVYAFLLSDNDVRCGLCVCSENNFTVRVQPGNYSFSPQAITRDNETYYCFCMIYYDLIPGSNYIKMDSFDTVPGRNVWDIAYMKNHSDVVLDEDYGLQCIKRIEVIGQIAPNP